MEERGQHQLTALNHGMIHGSKSPQKLQLSGGGCRQGWTAQQIFDELSIEEFGTGGTLFPVGNAGGSAAANAQVFAQWISSIFMTLAQVSPLALIALIALPYLPF